ncbi:cyclase family protein [Saccharopolyspora rhizosphaerae]|uniref:Cyclase family protein n=1 Tax=Saccharopolyspora rhizosphaerae TaxID=2492662 RepID=A0A3R8QB33_9PSEU|nr:cyclase family protein [Saccharopolyspora rhizosphaerae]RRO17019.1 cyclase family protein [Saccharopolyspora rhizosphaerae]
MFRTTPCTAPTARSRRLQTLDESSWAPGAEGAPDFPGGLHYADDVATIFLQGSSQYDVLGHVWYDGKIWNGYDADTTVEGLSKASVLPIAEKGVVGRGVLIDMAWYRGKDHLDKGETVDHEDLLAAAEKQGVTIQPHDVLLIRTGFTGYGYATTPEEFHEDVTEPGLTYSRELVERFQETESATLVTDTIVSEVTEEPETGVMLPLHCALLRHLGLVLSEVIWWDDLAEACARDNRWSFLYTAVPLKVAEGAGAPVNPIVIR